MKKLLILTLSGMLLITLILGACSAPAPAPAPAPSSPSAAAPTIAVTPASTPAAQSPKPAAAPATAPSTQPVTLSWVSFVAQNDSNYIFFKKGFADRLEKQSNGQIKMLFRGGPETIPIQNQGDAVRSDIVDIAVNSYSYHEALVPGASGMSLSLLTPREERKPGGLVDYLQGLYKKAGLVYLGRVAPQTQNAYNVFLIKKKPLTKADFAQLKIGGATSTRSAVLGWGAAAVMLTASDFTTALQQGVIDAISSSPLQSMVDSGRIQFVKYAIDHPYFQGAACAIMSLEKFNRLTPDQQKLVMDTMIQAENDIISWRDQELEEKRKAAEKGGVEFYKLAPDVADWFLKTAYDASWQYNAKQFPEVTAEIKKMASK